MILMMTPVTIHIAEVMDMVKTQTMLGMMCVIPSYRRAEI